MMSSDSDSQKTDFNDSSLQHAVRKCWSGECCPSRLRQRVEAMLQEAGESRQDGPFAKWGRWVLYPLAAAAIVSLVAGVWMYGSPAGPDSPAATAVIPASLQSDLIQTHDRCSHKLNHQMLSSGDDAALAKVMTAELKRPVLVARPSDSGWDFRGGAVCSVGSTRSGHLMFTSGTDALSVFSLPKSSMPDAPNGSEFETTVDGHPIVGFVRDGAVFCLVGSGPDANVSSTRLEQLRKNLEPRITEVASATEEQAPVVAVELIRPIGQ